MKKIAKLVMFFLITLTLMVACGDSQGSQSESGEKLDISGTYTGTMTFTKVEIVYDTDEDANGEETITYYEPEGESEWIGERVEATYKVEKMDDQSVTITSVGSDGSELKSFKGSYRNDGNKFFYEEDEIGGKNTITLEFSDMGDTIAAKGVILFTHTETGLVNEISLDLKKQ